MTSHDQPKRPFDNQNPTCEYTLRKMYGFYEGQVYKMFSRLPLYKTKLNPEQIMRYKTIMDSMTDKELDGLNPELTSMARKMEIARASRQDVKQVSEMIKEYLRLERVWRHVQILMSDTKMMDMSALFWNELTTSFNIEIVPKAENTRPNSSSDEYTLRKMLGFYKGHVYKMFSRLPLYKRKLNPEKIRQYNTIMDYMTDKELDDQKPVENLGEPRTLDILRESKIGVIPFFEMLSEFLRLERVWRDVEKLMSNTKLMDMSALFWNEIATTLDADIVPEVENIPPRKFELMNWVKCALVYLGTFVLFFWIGMSIP